MLDLVIDTRRKDLGGGFEIGRLLPYAKRRMVGPFVFFDHIGPASFEPNFPRSADVRPHPHIGLATVTYLFEGEMTHRDSLGFTQDIRPGEVNWMTAGRGITHSERFERLRREGGPIHGIQSWVALPTEHEETDPAFHHHEGAELPAGNEGGLRWRLVCGEAFGARAAVKTFSPIFYLHCELDEGAQVQAPNEYSERAAYVADGEVVCEGQTYHTGQMLVFAPNAPAIVRALRRSTVMLLGGEPLGPRFIEWNFVSSSKDRIEQAKADWRAGRMKLPDADDQEFIPLPEPPPPANPMS
jgi:redox-sensitive bicupin YhaK (pirin superfamily)